MNDNVQTMIERYRRELIEFNKRNPQKRMANPQLTESKTMAVEAAMMERDEMNKHISSPQPSMPQMNPPQSNMAPMNPPRTNMPPMNPPQPSMPPMNPPQSNMPPMNPPQSNMPQMNAMRRGSEDRDTASEYENSKLFIELNAADNNANGSDNNHRVMDRIHPQTGLTRLEQQAIMAMAEPASVQTPPKAPAQAPIQVPVQTPTAAKPSEAAANPETQSPTSLLFEKNAAENPPYSSGGARTYATFDEFQKANTKTGTLRVQASAADRSFPVSNAEVVVTKNFSGTPHVFYRVWTDISGVATGMTLPAPDRALTSYPSALAPYATYDVSVTHPKYVTVILRSCAIFDGIETIQFCEMIPKVTSTQQATVFEEQPSK